MDNAFLRKMKKIKAFLLDLDGTVYIEGELIGDMKNTLAAIRASGRKIVYLTNNSSKTGETYVERLKNIGIWDGRDRVYTSGDATIAYLKNNFADRRVYLMGTEKLRAEFAREGIILDDKTPEVTVLAYDTEINYEKLSKVALFLKRGTPYIATHPDVNCPAKEADVPDIGSYIKLFEASAGRLPDVVVGKPYRYMGEGIKAITGYSEEELVMVGDRLYTDIKFGLNNGFRTALVLSGETTAETYKESGLNADVVFASLNDVVSYL